MKCIAIENPRLSDIILSPFFFLDLYICEVLVFYTHFDTYYSYKYLQKGAVMGIFHKKQTLPPDQKLLFDEINKAKTQIELAQINFQSALDPDLIDYYIFEANAAWKRYCFLLRQARLQ